MYEVIALCICTSCISCICCFVTGALCMVPKLLQARKDFDAHGARRNVPGSEVNEENTRVIYATKGCHDNDDFKNKVTCRCPKKIIVHTLPIAEEAICGLRKRDGCLCSPFRFDENL